MTTPDLLAELVQAIGKAGPESLPAIIGSLEAAKAKAWARLACPPVIASEADRLLTMPDVASRLGITEHQAREMGRRGELPVVMVGERHVRVREGALTDWIRLRERATLSRRGGR